jgi:uncharacterized HhH-GPD family protein
MDYAQNRRSETMMNLQLPMIDSPDGSLEFIIGIICNQAIRAEVAWRAADGLRERLGHMDAWRFAAMDELELAAVIGQRVALHPFARTMGRNIVGTCRLLCDHYDGLARALWDDRPTATDLVERFVAFPGIGKHKAEVALFLLTSVYGIAVREDRPLDAALSHCTRLGDFFGP